MQEIGDVTRVAGGFFFSLIVLLAVSFLPIVTSETIWETRYGYLGIYKSSCVVQMLVPHMAVTTETRH